MKQNSVKDILVISLKLLTICAIVATIVAFVNGITKDKIAYNEKLNTAEALSGIYAADYEGKTFEVNGNDFIIKENDEIAVRCSVSDADKISEDITDLYILKDKDGSSLGYCVAIQPMGFKDVIKMLVAVNIDSTVKGVKIVSMSDTKGIGTKAQDEPWFLNQFIGKSSEIAASSDIKTIAGATKTTKPITEAVARAVNQVNTYISESGGVEQ